MAAIRTAQPEALSPELPRGPPRQRACQPGRVRDASRRPALLLYIARFLGLRAYAINAGLISQNTPPMRKPRASPRGAFNTRRRHRT